MIWLTAYHPFGAIEFPDDYEVRVALDIAETKLKFWAYLERFFRLMLRAQSLRNLLSAGVRASDIPKKAAEQTRC